VRDVRQNSPAFAGIALGTLLALVLNLILSIGGKR
jgi:xanthine/uracil permease